MLVFSLGVDVLGWSVEDDVSEGLKQGVENELNSMSVCMPNSPVGGGGGGASDLQRLQCPCSLIHLFNKRTMTAMVVATAHIKNPIDVEKYYKYIYI